jgi:hypothetical protein
MKVSILSAVAVAAMALSGSAKAGDLYITETVNGIITSGTDTDNIFGAGVDAVLIGYFASLTFTYDATALGADGLVTDGSTYEYYLDASGNPAIAVDSLTINGTTITDSSYTYGGAGWNATSGPCHSGDFYQFADPTGSTSIESDVCGGPYTIGSGAPLSQSAIDANFAGATGAVFYDDDGTNLEAFDIRFTPEPATWFSLAMGLGGVALLKFRPRPRSR